MKDRREKEEEGGMTGKGKGVRFSESRDEGCSFVYAL